MHIDLATIRTINLGMGLTAKKQKKFTIKLKKGTLNTPTLENLELKKTASLKYKKSNEPIH